MYDTISNDLKEALKNGDKFTLSVLRMLKSAIDLEAINTKSEKSDDFIKSVLKRQVKQRTDSQKVYEDLGKAEVVDDLTKEILIINNYLPESSTAEEIEAVITKAFTELKPSSMKDMGKIMKYVSSNLPNADMAKVSDKVKERLTK